MHPVESTIYYTACLCSIPFGVHPVIPLAMIYDCGLQAWIGHSGFVWPGSGNWYHVIHHMYFDANYGTPNMPFDWLFGTFSATGLDCQDLWKTTKDKIGLAANEGSIHEPNTTHIKVE